MRKATRNIVLLAALVVLLGAGVYAELGYEQASGRAPLTKLDPATVQRLEVRCQTCRTRRFARGADGWRMLEPYALPADADAVTHLLVIARAPVSKRLDLREYDLAKLGLSPPQFTLTFDDVVVTIGGEDSIEHDRYVRVGDELLRVPDRFSARLLEAPERELAVDPNSAPKP
jgi:hypothetical protein